MKQAGFTFIEIMVVVAIITVLSAIAVVSLGAMKERMLLRTAAGDIVSTLEELKARSVAGTGGVEHGLRVDEDSYTEFSGSDFDEDDADNVTHEIDDALSLSIDTMEDNDHFVFSRINGSVSGTVLITVSLRSDPDKNRTIVVGTGGDISYGE